MKNITIIAFNLICFYRCFLHVTSKGYHLISLGEIAKCISKVPAIREFLRSLGFVDEPRRSDRDKYIRIIHPNSKSKYYLEIS